MLKVKTASLLDGVGLGDYGEFMNDYRTSDNYFCDVVSEIADANTSIYYSDIIAFISENVEAVNDAIKEFGWDGCGSDLYKAGQMAEYLQIENDLLSRLEDCCLLLACDYLRYDLDTDEIPEELAECVKEWAAEADHNDRISDFLGRIDSWFEEREQHPGHVVPF